MSIDIPPIQPINWQYPSWVNDFDGVKDHLSDEEKKKALNRLDEIFQENALRWQYANTHHRNDKGDEMDFTDKPYLIDIYADQAQDIVIQKAVQLGVTEWAICETFSLCERGYSVFYVLPKYAVRNTFVANRIQKTTNRVPYYKKQIKEAVGESESRSMYHFAKGTIKFVSSETESDFGEFPADCFIIDEYHDCDSDNILMCEDRISASTLKARRKIGNPSYAEVGINAEFLLSDMKEWHIQCEACGKHQFLDWYKHVVKQTGDNTYDLLDTKWQQGDAREINLYCEHCHKPINRLAHGHWFKTSESHISGYHLSKLFTPTTTITELYYRFLQALRKDSLMEIFHNRDLGIIHSKANYELNQAFYDKCKQNFHMPGDITGDCTMGVDVGKMLHVRISQWIEDKENDTLIRKPVHIGTVNQFEDLHRLVKRYGVKTIVIDALPETRKAKEFQQYYKHDKDTTVWICFYTEMSGEKKLDKIIKKSNNVVNVDRNQTLSDLVDSYANCESVLPLNYASFPDYLDQMTSSQLEEEERKGQIVYVWTRKRADHYFHAENYDMIAKRLKRNRLKSRFA